MRRRFAARLRKRLVKLARHDRGSSAVEYGIMVAAIAAVIVGTVFALGGLVKSSFDRTCSAISDPQGQTCVDGVLAPKAVPTDTGGGGLVTEPTDTSTDQPPPGGP